MTTFTKNSEDARSAKASDPRSAKASAERQLDDIPTRVEELLEQYNGTLSRRTFLKGSGMLVVSFSAAAVAGPFATGASAQAAGPYPDPNFRQLDSWIVVITRLLSSGPMLRFCPLDHYQKNRGALVNWGRVRLQ